MDLIRKTFENCEIRAISIENEPWFIAKDIVEVLGYKNPSEAVRDHCKNIKILKTSDLLVLGLDATSPRGYQIIGESDLYRLIIKSKLPEAEKFEKWVMEEVLPSIRKHGAYMTSDTIERALTDPDFLIELATKLKEERSKREQAEKEKQILEEERLKALPKVQVFDSIINQDGLFSIRSTAKTLQVPERKFIDFLIEKKIMFRNPKKQLEPYAKTVEKGLMEIKLVETERGGAKSQAKFTVKGQAWVTLVVNKYDNFFHPESIAYPHKQN